MNKRFYLEGMTCHSCVSIIKKEVKKLEGVNSVKVSLTKGEAIVNYDSEKINIDTIYKKIEEKGYFCLAGNEKPQTDYLKTGSMMVLLAGVLVVGYFLYSLIGGVELPALSANISYGLLFIVGLLTGFHCIAMCGGFMVSYTAKDAKAGRPSHMSHVKYAIGKTLSYTIIGAVFGLIGSIIAFTPMMRGVAGILAGIFLVLFGVKMLGVKWLNKFSFKAPSFIYRLTGKNSSPLVIGLLNGLMIACGPLQAIYIMAAGTGSMVEGAKLLFVFGLGTLPVMLGFGFFATIVSSKMTHKILKASGVIVLILGVVMVNRGLALTGTGYDAQSLFGRATLATGINFEVGNAEGNVVLNNGYQEIHMTVDRSGWSPDKFVLQKDVPVRWIITGEEITGCNNAINVPKYDLEFGIEKGEQIIEFTPTEEGIIPWSCWMGMIPGTFVVVDGDVSEEEAEKVLDEVQIVSGSSGGSCSSPSCGAASGSGGSCGCGG